MKTQRIFLFFGLAMLIFVATIFLFVYKTFSPGSGGNNTPNFVSPSQTASNTPNQPSQPDTSTPPQTAPPQSDTHTALEDCIALKTSDAQGKNYEPGSLLVSFADIMGYETALATIRDLGLDPDPSQDAKNNFTQYHWLPVAVPKGQEFKWQCVLDASEGIKKASLNATFNLSQ